MHYTAPNARGYADGISEATREVLTQVEHGDANNQQETTTSTGPNWVQRQLTNFTGLFSSSSTKDSGSSLVLTMKDELLPKNQTERTDTGFVSLKEKQEEATTTSLDKPSSNFFSRMINWFKPSTQTEENNDDTDSISFEEAYSIHEEEEEEGASVKRGNWFSRQGKVVREAATGALRTTGSALKRGASSVGSGLSNSFSSLKASTNERLGGVYGYLARVQEATKLKEFNIESSSELEDNDYEASLKNTSKGFLSDNSPLAREDSVMGKCVRAALITRNFASTSLLPESLEAGALSEGENLGDKMHRLARHVVQDPVNAVSTLTANLTTTLTLLPLYHLDSLVGSLDDVVQTYETARGHFASPDSFAAKSYARLVQGVHFIAWVAKNAAVLAGAGLSILVNTVLGTASKLTNCVTTLTVDLIAKGIDLIGVAAKATGSAIKEYGGRAITATADFCSRHGKKLLIAIGGGALLGGLSAAIYALVTSGGGAVAATGLGAISPYLGPALGIALGALLGVYLLLRGARVVYNYFSEPSQIQLKLERLTADNNDLREDVIQLKQTIKEGKTLVEDGDQTFVKTFGNSITRKAKADSVRQLLARVLGTNMKHRAYGMARDFLRTMSLQWNIAKSDINVYQRALRDMSEEEIINAVANYSNSDRRFDNEHTKLQAALLTALLAEKRVVEYETPAPGKKKDGLYTVKKQDLDQAIVNLLSGSDEEVMNSLTSSINTTPILKDKFTDAMKQLGEAKATLRAAATEADEELSDEEQLQPLDEDSEIKETSFDQAPTRESVRLNVSGNYAAHALAAELDANYPETYQILAASIQQPRQGYSKEMIELFLNFDSARKMAKLYHNDSLALQEFIIKELDRNVSQDLPSDLPDFDDDE